MADAKAGLQQGFTIMELVIVLLVTGIILAAVAPVFNTQIRAYLQVRDGKDLLQSSRITLSLLANELAGIQDSAHLTDGRSNRITFHTTVNGVNLNNVRYRVSGDMIFRQATGVAEQPSLYGVRQLNFLYFNDAGVQIPPNVNSFSNVYRIRITLTTGDDDHQLTLTRDVVPRNFFSMQ